jgi:DNA-binding LytR/AlgR family response regulator
MLAAMANVQVVGALHHGDEVLPFLKNNAVDAVLLDIRMPGLDGLSLAEWLAGNGPCVVLVSAYDDHALQAFDLDVVDYLTKPVRPARLKRALERLRERLAGKAAAPGGGPNAATSAIALPQKDRQLIVAVAEIRYVLCVPSGLEIGTNSGKLFVPWNLRQMEDLLAQQGDFQKVSRQALVNLACLREIFLEPGGTSRLLLTDGSRVTASRSATAKLRARFRLSSP